MSRLRHILSHATHQPPTSEPGADEERRQWLQEHSLTHTAAPNNKTLTPTPHIALLASL
jgi:hypothetical protein